MDTLFSLHFPLPHSKNKAFTNKNSNPSQESRPPCGDRSFLPTAMRPVAPSSCSNLLAVAPGRRRGLQRYSQWIYLNAGNIRIRPILLQLPVSPANEELICRVVQDACKSALSGCPTTTEEERQLKDLGLCGELEDIVFWEPK
ncbi:hypothetical protein ACFX13_011533 [Malus domestica]